jgi:hypothetical protein
MMKAVQHYSAQPIYCYSFDYSGDGSLKPSHIVNASNSTRLVKLIFAKFGFKVLFSYFFLCCMHLYDLYIHPNHSGS